MPEKRDPSVPHWLAHLTQSQRDIDQFLMKLLGDRKWRPTKDILTAAKEAGGWKGPAVFDSFERIGAISEKSKVKDGGWGWSYHRTVYCP